MSEKITLMTNQSYFDQATRNYAPRILVVEPSERVAFSYLRDGGHGGLTVNLKDGTSFGIREKLSDILARTANIDESSLKNIKVTVNDRGNGQAKIQTNAAQGAMLASMDCIGPFNLDITSAAP